MAVQPVLIKNTNKFGKVTNKWFVRIGKEWKLFGKEEVEAGEHIAWLNQHRLAADPEDSA